MKALVICPDRPTKIPFMARKRPVSLTPVLGPSLLGHALATLAERGAKQVLVLAVDRPELVREAVGQGERWGLKITVIPESRELSVVEARAKYRTLDAEWLVEGDDILVADRLPGDVAVSPLNGAKDWFAMLERWLPEAHRHRIGAREVSPGVWMGLRCRIEEGAEIQGPCWLGDGVWVRARAKIGPNSFIEDHALIDHEAEVCESWIGPATYVGAMTHVERSFAWGHGLLNQDTGSFIEVPDAFLLSDLETIAASRLGASFLGRVLAFVAAIVTSPVALWALLRGAKPQDKRAVVPVGAGGQASIREVTYREFSALSGLWRRWPWLWNIVRGEFAWVGNPPLTREQAEQLDGEFEQLWLAAPIGLVSLADAEGCTESFGEEARIHASFYAAQAGPRLDRQILRRTFHRACRGHLT